jgi:hypothetical protein
MFRYFDNAPARAAGVCMGRICAAYSARARADQFAHQVLVALIVSGCSGCWAAPAPNVVRTRAPLGPDRERPGAQLARCAAPPVLWQPQGGGGGRGGCWAAGWASALALSGLRWTPRHLNLKLASSISFCLSYIVRVLSSENRSNDIVTSNNLNLI